MLEIIAFLMTVKKPSDSSCYTAWFIWILKAFVILTSLGQYNLNLTNYPQQPNFYLGLFQLDDSKPLLGKWYLHPFKTGCLGFQETLKKNFKQTQVLAEMKIK